MFLPMESLCYNESIRVRVLKVKVLYRLKNGQVAIFTFSLLFRIAKLIESR